MTGHGRLVGLVLPLVAGATLGLGLASAPAVAGETAITDPVWLGIMWFVAPGSIVVVVPPLIHLGFGVGVGFLGMLVRAISPTVVILIAVSVNGAATLIENGEGAGVVGVLWWLLGTVLSAVLMLIGVHVVRRVMAMRAPAPHRAQVADR